MMEIKIQIFKMEDNVVRVAVDWGDPNHPVREELEAALEIHKLFGTSLHKSSMCVAHAESRVSMERASELAKVDKRAREQGGLN